MEKISSSSSRLWTVWVQTIVPLEHPATKLGLALTEAESNEKTRFSNHVMHTNLNLNIPYLYEKALIEVVL